MGKPQGSLKRSALWAARGAWWLVTPWRWPERVRFMRARAAAEPPRPFEVVQNLARRLVRIGGAPQLAVAAEDAAAEAVPMAAVEVAAL